MDLIQYYIGDLIFNFGWEGITMMIISLALFLWNMHYFLFELRKIYLFRLSRKEEKILEEAPGVSVIIPMFYESTEYIDSDLNVFLNQKYSNFEVIVVYVGEDIGFKEYLEIKARNHPILRTTHILRSPKYRITNKVAINLGVKAANYDHVIITTTDTTPLSDKWLGLMAKGFQYSNIITGYTSTEASNSFLNTIVRRSNFVNSLPWIASTIAHKPFSCARTNFGFTKKLYFEANGFNYLSLNAGEGDLFIQKISKNNKVNALLSPKAVCVQKYWEGLSTWGYELNLQHKTQHYYPFRFKWMMQKAIVMKSLFYIACILSIVLLKLDMQIFAGVLLILHYIVEWFITTRVASRIGEKRIYPWEVIFPIIDPFIRFFVRIFFNKSLDD